jgi:hypothetical protein
VVAKAYYLANVGVDALYLTSYFDNNGHPYNGSLTYQLTFTPSQLPIYTNRTGWWSLIAYDPNVSVRLRGPADMP